MFASLLKVMHVIRCNLNDKVAVLPVVVQLNPVKFLELKSVFHIDLIVLFNARVQTELICRLNCGSC